MGSDKGSAALEKGVREDLSKEATLNKMREQTVEHILGESPAGRRTECTWRGEQVEWKQRIH